MKTVPLKPLAKACLWALGLAAGSAQAQMTCGITANNTVGIYTTAQLNLTAAVNLNCTRTGGALTQTVYIGMDQGEPPNGRNMTRQTTTTNETLAYQIYRNTGGAGQWTTGAGRVAGNTQNGGRLHTFNFTTGNNQSLAMTYFFRVNAGINRAAGIYDDEAVGLFVRLGNSNASPLITSTTFTTNVSIVAHCYFSSAPTPLTMNYTSFASAASTGASNFGVNCTLNTPYTMALDATSGTLLGLNYTLNLPVASGTGTAFRQNYVVSGSIAAGQSGTCAATAGCTATQARTLTITY
ncbi:MAG: spore coat protein U domain-containing protein [Burkholderiaceae bacterium]